LAGGAAGPRLDSASLTSGEREIAKSAGETLERIRLRKKKVYEEFLV
jgi:hypothetical protein